MAEIARYDIGSHDGKLWPIPHGELVLYADYKAVVERLIAEYEEKITELLQHDG
jgi:hypothetical protein